MMLKKTWWTSAVLITSAANTLNKAHVKYLEARLIEEARAIGKIDLENGTTPIRASLSEAAQANMEAYLEYILMVLPALRIDCFLQNTRPKATPATGASATGSHVPVFELRTPKHGIQATARLENGEFVVQSGSKARKAWEGTPTHNYASLFEELVKSGVLKDDGSHRIFSENYAFPSASAAGAVLNGRATNGQEAWKVLGQNKTYKQWEAEKLASESPAPE